MITECNKVQGAIYPQSVSSAGTTSIYFNLSKAKRAAFVWEVVQTGLTATSTGLIYQATDEVGSNAAAITATSTVLYATSNLTQATITPTISAGETAATVTINGLTFTAVSATGTAVTASRQFLASTANVSTTITNMAAVINDVTYGVPGVRALAGSAALTLHVDEDPAARIPDNFAGMAITSSSTSDLTIGAVYMSGVIEIDGSKLTLSSNFTHVALNVINVSANQTAASLIRCGLRYAIPDPVCPVTRYV